MNPEQIFLSHRPLLEKAAAHACKRYRFTKEEVEDFTSYVMLKIIEDNYGVLRKFQGRSSLPTFLTVVVQRCMLDYRNHLLGKWRHSAEAKRLGPVAERLEELLRDSYTFDEACQILQVNEKVDLSWRKLLALAARLPPRSPRKVQGEEGLQKLPAPESQPDLPLVERERQILRRRIFEALQQAIAKLSDEDRLILKLSMEQKVSEIARSAAVDLDQKSLYRCIEKIRRFLRQELERDFDGDEIQEVLGS